MYIAIDSIQEGVENQNRVTDDSYILRFRYRRNVPRRASLVNLQVTSALRPYRRRFVDDPVRSITARLDGLRRDS